MKKIIAITLLTLFALILLCALGCRSSKEATIIKEETKEQVSRDTKKETKSEADTAIKSDTQITSSTNEEGETVTTTEKTDYTPFIDPKTGNLTNLPTHKETTTTTHKKSKKGEVKTGNKTTVDNKENKSEISDEKSKDKKTITSEEETKTKKVAGVKYVYYSLLIGGIMALIILLVKYKSNILTALKWIVKPIKTLFK